MNSMKAKKTIIILILGIVLVSNLSLISNSSPNILDWWNREWSNRTEIKIPFDTDLPESKFQPIDTNIKFEKLAWAKNCKENSIRVIFQKESNYILLESQIYNLNFCDENHIKSCNLIFLIPNEADGSEKYYVYYDEEPKEKINIIDHVKVEESYYQYSPIPGYSTNSEFYSISDDGYHIYQICYKGKTIGRGSSNIVTKVKDKSKELVTKNGEAIANFDFLYYPPKAKGLLDYHSTSERLISKEIIVDGNLMAYIGIVSESKNSDLKTTAYYKYYHCPTEDKRLHVKIKHETFDDIDTFPKNILSNSVIAKLRCGWSKSNSIDDLNFGRLLPNIYVYNDKDFISNYRVDKDPEYIPPGKSINIINTIDDIDLGKEGWACFSDGKIGSSHSLIFDDTNIIKKGKNVRDGIQVKAYEEDYPHLPGLEVNSEGLIFTSNTYEPDEEDNFIIPKDFCAEFNVEFYTSVNGGYEKVQKEAEIFKSLIKIKPNEEIIINTNKKNIASNSLTVFLHNSLSSPLGVGISALTGLNISYDTVEVLKDQRIVRSGTPSNIEIKEDLNEIKTTGLSGFKNLFKSINWKNFSFFKKIQFKNLEKGRYVVKIYRNNCKFKVDKKLIGFKVIDIDSDKKSHIFCKAPGLFSFSIKDQNNDPINEVKYKLSYNEICIIEDKTENENKTIISVPISLENNYEFELEYKGFKIYKDQIKIGLLNTIKPGFKKININLYDLEIDFIDTLGLKSDINIKPYLTSNDSIESFSDPVEIKEKFVFKNLLSAQYILCINYQNKIFKNKIILDKNKKLNIEIPVEYKLKTNIFDSRGNKIEDYKLILRRDEKEIKYNIKENNINIPPGLYELEVFSNNKLIAKRNIDILRDSEITIVSNNNPNYPNIIILISVISFILGSIILYKKKRFFSIIALSVIIFSIISLTMPWWSIETIENEKGISSSTNMYLMPTKITTLTSNQNTIAGEISFIPDLFITATYIIFALVIIGCIFISLNIIIKTKINKKLSLLILILGILSFIASVGIFTYAMNEYANVATGSFIGTGKMDIGIPGENFSENIVFNWGPGIGYYIMLLSIIIIVIYLILRWEMEKDNIENKKAE